MKCYNCGAELTRDSFCPNCGIDVRVYKKIIMASNACYNEGLAKASVRDLTGAIESLKLSLRYNKMNTMARNLLGLIHFEMGDTVDALSEWVISKNLKSEHNSADRYLAEIQKNPSRLETINQTIKKYNQALLYCKQDSRDLAIIQLKKVLSLNPKLVKGHQLLGLLYIQEEKYDQAKKSLRAAAKIDNSNTNTLRYMKEVNRMLKQDSAGKRVEKKDDLVSYKSGNETIIQPKRPFRDISVASTIINIVIGVAIGAAITGFLIVPGVRQSAQSEANATLKESSDTIATKNQTIESLNNQIEDLNSQLDEANSASTANNDKLTSYEQLLNAYISFRDGDITAAGDTLAQVKTEDLSATTKEIYDSVNEEVNKQYVASAYNDGMNAYNSKNYTDAVTNLEKVVAIDESYQDGNAIYYLAQSYRNAGDNEKAIEYYNKMIEAYPGTERAANSQRYVESLQAEAGTTGTTGDTAPDTTGDQPAQ